MNLLRLFYPCLAFVVPLLTSCKSPLPDSDDLTRFYEQAEQLAKHDIHLLDGQLAAGQITQIEYTQRKEAILGNIQRRAVDAAWTQHQMRESERKAMGLPTPDAPQEISVPQGDSLPTGSERRAFNSGDQTLGSNGNPQAVKEFFRGFRPGGNVKGNTSRGNF